MDEVDHQQTECWNGQVEDVTSCQIITEAQRALPEIVITVQDVGVRKGEGYGSTTSIDSAYVDPETTSRHDATKDCVREENDSKEKMVLISELNKSHESFDSAYTDSLTSTDSRTALLKQQLDGGHGGDSDEVKDVNLARVLTGNELAESQEENLPLSAKSSFWDITDFGHEIEAKNSRPRTNTMARLTESAAYIDDMYCPSPGVSRLKSACRNAVQNLSQEMVFKSMSVLELDKQGLKVPDSDVDVEIEEIGFINNHMRNLIVLSVGISLTNTAIGSLRNLQSSLNHDGGIGLYSLAAASLSFTIFSLLTPFVVQKFRPKRCLIFSLFTQLLYVVGNLQPTFYVFIPASFLQGLGNALLWNSMSTYTTYLARASALKNNERTVDVASKYFGIFFFFFQFSVVLGNLISSLVLVLGQKYSSIHNHTTSSSPDVHVTYDAGNVINGSHFNISNHMSHDFVHYEFCGSAYCHSFKLDNTSMEVNEETKYVLLGIYGMCVVFAVVGCAYLLDPVKTYVSSSSSCGLIANQIVAVLRCLVDWRYLLISGILMYSNMQLAFVTAEVTKAFVTCPVGIYMVGYCMIVYGVCGGTTSFIGGRLTKYIGRIPLIVAAAGSNLALLTLMVFWQPKPDQVYTFFLLLGAWGLGDGIWLSQVNCIISALFPEKLEEAFAASRTLQGLGGAIAMGYAGHLCMMSKMGIMAIVCIISTCLYITVENLVRRRASADVNDDKQLTKA